jgi:hypothetical protein
MLDRAAAIALLCMLALLTTSACGGGTTKSQPSAEPRMAPVIGTAWAAAHNKSLGGLHGRFRSEIVSVACRQPPVKPCTVGGAASIDQGVFTLHKSSSSYLHVAFGNGADATELSGYRVRNLDNFDTYIQAVNGGRSSRCWTSVSSQLDFGSSWGYIQGFDVVNDAEPDIDPPLGQGAAELIGHVPAHQVLDYLGVSDLDTYEEFDQDVPVHLRLDAKGFAAGFWVDGEEVAIALVGPAPNTSGATNPAALVRAEDSARATAVREVLSPMHGDFRMYAFDMQPKVVVAPAKALLLGAAGKRRNPTCAAAR